MTELGTDDYPLAERRPEIVAGRRGKPLDALTIEAVLAGEVTMEDLRITPQALRQQAGIARAAGRPTLAANFERAAELAEIPQEVVMRVYELLRPGRARSRSELVAAAAMLRRDHSASLIAAFVEEAAAVYERRGLFTTRY
jgi:propanediol dehydratase small subunit